MAKIFFGKKSKSQQHLDKRMQFSHGFQDERLLFQQRSKKYFDLIGKLDTELLTDTSKIQELIDQLQKELGIPGMTEMPVGIISKCFLGIPYEVHTLDLSGQIIYHYKTSEKMPPLFEPYRNLALHHAYAVIEIYQDKVLIVNSDGSVVKL